MLSIFNYKALDLDTFVILKKINLKRLLLIILLITIIAGGYIAWQVVGPTIHQPVKKAFFVKTGSTVDQVKQDLVEQGIVKSTFWLNNVSKILKFIKARPGRYEIKQGMGLLALLRTLRNGQQSPVSFIVTKFRTRQNLAAKVGNQFECDSASMMDFLSNNDSLKTYNLDTNTAMAAVMPLSYPILWTSKPKKIFQQFYTAYKAFWNQERIAKALEKGLSPLQVVTLASIIEEETQKDSDKPNIASVYLNRLQKFMPLGADPTIKFALKDFGLRRILNSHLQVASPYNTYRNAGLPPGPICTPAVPTIEAVLNAPKTEYLYFVASPAFDGTHVFTTNYSDHMKQAALYQAELNKRQIK